MDDLETVKIITKSQINYFSSGHTKPVAFRITALRKLRKVILAHQDAICESLKKDLRKSEIESIQGEIAPSIAEIDYAIKHVKKWAKRTRAKSPALFLLSSGYTQRVPYGVVAIFSPYNHPFSTTFTPLVSAIAAGNCVIIKPSELVPASALLIKKIINEAFPESYVSVFLGGREVAESLLQQPLDYIFFTGSTAVGKVIMKTAAEQLIPITLELSGKCPGIVHKDANLNRAAARIAWGKFWNAGQACNTIDHLFVHESVKDEFLKLLIGFIKKYYTENPQQSDDYGRIVNQRHFDRLATYLNQGNILHGGITDRDDLYISPTIIDLYSDVPLHTEEVFGPILPIYYYQDMRDVINNIKRAPKSLAFYLFTKDQKLSEQTLALVDSGTACINDLMIQSTSVEMPIGGVGASGFGRMHGQAGFDTFTYIKSTLKNDAPDIPLRFPPYNKKFILPILKKFL